MTTRRGSQPDPPSESRCPACRSPRTFETFQHYGDRFYFCVDCEHTWSLAAEQSGDDTPPPRRRRP